MDEERKLVPVFIGGTGRSGTTILRRILSRHSKIASVPFELRVHVDPGGALDLIRDLSDNWSPYNADIAIQRFRSMMRNAGGSSMRLGVLFWKVWIRCFKLLGISPRPYTGMACRRAFGGQHYRESIERLTSDLAHDVSRGIWIGSPAYRVPSKLYNATLHDREFLEKRLSDFFHGLFAKRATRGETHIVEDTPYNLLHADGLLGLFPRMRLIHIYRDPRDVLASYQRFSWGGTDFAVIARRLADIYRRWLVVREALPSESFMEISLETLAEQPTAALTQLCEFVGLEFEESLLEIPLNRVNAGRWKKDVPPGEWEAAEPFISPYVDLYGYSP